MNMVYENKDKLLKEAHELFIMTSKLSKTNLKFQASSYMYGGYGIYTLEYGKGCRRD